MRVEEEMFKKVFGESAEETLREASEEGVVARARKVEAVPSKKEVEGRDLDHAVFRSWRPHCVKGLAEACGHRKKGGETGDAPTVSLDYMHTCSEQERWRRGCRSSWSRATRRR